jgi:hypothetical protein
MFRMPNRANWFFSIALLTPLMTAVGLAREVQEKFDDGTIHLRYQVDAANHKSGDYLENYPTGKVHIRGNYTADKKSGTWTTYSDTGKPTEIASYRNDQLDGPYQWNFPSGTAQMKTLYRAGTITGPVNTFDEGGTLVFNLSYPIPWEAVQKAWHTWAPVERKSPHMLEEPVDEKPYKAGRMADESQQAALKYLQLYRFLSGVPVTGMGIDPQYASAAQHGAVILSHLGRLSHTPDRPADMDDSFYKIAYSGTSQSNISEGRNNLFDSIDDYMFDSDESNVQRVGHRQWMLMPSMQKTAFGFCGRFSTLYSFDGSVRENWNWSYVAYPGPGFYPHEMLRARTAWSVSINTRRFKVGSTDSLTIRVSTLDEHYAIIDTTTASIVDIAPCPNAGIYPCIIFKPGTKSQGVGRYVVQIAGIRTISNAPAPLTYLVDVREMIERN